MRVCVCARLCTERADLRPAVGTVPHRSPFSRSLQALADYASENLEAMNPPLFLRFLNLLMNDAIFLLDEAIQVGLTARAVGITQATVLAPLTTAGCDTHHLSLERYQLALLRSCPTNLCGRYLQETVPGWCGRCPGRRGEGRGAVGSGALHARHSLPSLRSREAGQDEEEQRGLFFFFFQIQRGAPWGSCEAICLLLIWTQPGFKQPLRVLIIKSPWPFRRCFILTKAFCLQAVLLWVYKASAR